MGADEPHEKQVCVVRDTDHQHVIVALDVEHDAPVLQDARIADLRLDIGRLAPLRLGRQIKPDLQRLLGIRVLEPEVSQRLECKHSHLPIMLPLWDQINSDGTGSQI